MTDLDNDETWTTGDGETIALEDMEPRHRRNVLAWLEKRAEALKLADDLSLCSVVGPSGDAASDMFEMSVGQQFEMSAAEWLEEQPLVIALRDLESEAAK